METPGATETTGDTGLLSGQPDTYDGVVVDVGTEPADSALFADRLQRSLQVAILTGDDANR